MNITCKDLERILERRAPRELAALEDHAAGCGVCREQMTLDGEISAAARGMQRAWESPELWPRIRERLVAEPRPAESRWKLRLIFGGFRLNWQVAAVAAALALVAVTSTWVVLRNQPAPIVVSTEQPVVATTPPASGAAPGTTPAPVVNAGAPLAVPAETKQQRLLTEEALGEVERAEAAYIRSIDRLSKLATPQLQESGTPLIANYREKLLLLDSAIAECRAQLEQNRFNGHLRRELLAIYQMKQSTLTEMLQEEAR